MRKFYTLLFALLTVCGFAQAQTTVTFEAGTDATATDADRELTKDGVTLTITDGRLNTPQYRIYKNQTLTINSTVGDIVGIEFTCTASGTAKEGPGCFAEQEGYSYEDKIGTWTGAASEVVFLAETNQVRATKIVVTIGSTDPNFVAAPSIRPVTGTYYSAQEVTIAVAEGTTVYYTTDGSEPTTESATYTEPFTVEQTTTVKAIAVKGENKSDVAESVITIENLATQTIAAILAAGPVDQASTVGTVYAVYGSGLMLCDNSGFITVFLGSAPSVAVGDAVNVTGKVVSYGGCLQFDRGTTVDKVGTAEVTYPEIRELDGPALDALVEAPAVTYVKVTGKLVISGNYKNLEVEDAAVKGSLQCTAEVLGNAADGDKVEVIGFFAYTSGSTTKYANIIATSVTVVEAAAPVVVPEYSTIAELKASAKEEKASMVYVAENVLVTFVNGSNVYVTDGTDGMLLYGRNSGFKAGDRISAKVKGDLYIYKGLTEIAVTEYADLTVNSSDNEILPEKVDLATLLSNYSAYENELVIIEDVTPQAAAWDDNRVVVFMDDSDNEINVRDNFKVLTSLTFDMEKTYSVTGFVALYADEAGRTIRIYPRSAADLNNGEEPITPDPQPVTEPRETSLDNPYTVAELRGIVAESSKEYVQEDAWVVGYIVGYINGSSLSEKTAMFTAEAPEGVDKNEQPLQVAVSNILIADEFNATAAPAISAVAPVAMPNNQPARTDLNLKDNPDKLGVKVWLQGDINKYMEVTGLRNVKHYSLDGINSTAVKAVSADAAAEGDIFTVTGQRVSNARHAGFYVIGNKKVLVK